MKIGINLLLWTDDVRPSTIDALIEPIREAGYDGVEIPIFDPDVDRFAEVGNHLRAADLKCTALTVIPEPGDLISLDPEVRSRGVNHVRACLNCARAMGAEMLVGPIHSGLGVFSGLPATYDQRRWALDAVQEIMTYAALLDIRVAVEPLNRFENYFLTSTHDAIQFVDEVDHPDCGILYDSFHAHIEEKSIRGAIHEAGKRITHIHVSENDRSTPGTGQVNWDETFDTLFEIGYDGWLMVEAFGTALAGLAAATKIWRRMYEREDQLMVDALAFVRRELKKRQNQPLWEEKASL